MRLLLAFFFGMICLRTGALAELTPSSCSLLRTAASITTIVPEVAQLAMRYYRVSSSSLPSSNAEHHRHKRFLFADNLSREGSGASRGSVFEQMVANAFKDVNYTRVALLILSNNDSINRIRQNIDGEAIVRVALRNIDYEKLGRSFWHAAEAEFDLEYIVSSFINVTQLDTIYNEVVTTGALPHWFIKRIHPNLNVRAVDQIFETLKNLSRKFLTIMNSSENFDEYLFQTIQQQALTPMEDIIRRVKAEKPATLDQLVEIILNNVNKIVMDQFSTTIESVMMKRDIQAATTTAAAAVEEAIDNDEDVKLLFYQCAVAVDSIGHTARVLLKALEQLYCTSIWD